MIVMAADPPFHVGDALIVTGIVLLLLAVPGWIVAGVIFGGESSYERNVRPPWLWPGIFGALGLLSALIVALWIVAAWSAVS